VQEKLTYLNKQTLVEVTKECVRRRLPSKASKTELVAQLFVLEWT
jgi:hypothetical protein